MFIVEKNKLCSSENRGTYPEEHKPVGMSGPMNIRYVPRPRDTEEHNQDYVPRGTPRSISPLYSSGFPEKYKSYVPQRTKEHN
jgi:hypothetical protein